MINIICLKWGNKYGPEYVNNLYRSVCQNTTVGFKFYCFTDDIRNIDSGVICHLLPDHGLEGWWNKLYLFSRDLPFVTGEKIFFLDLDTLIVGNIDPILDVEYPMLVTVRDFYTDLSSVMAGGDYLQSCVMHWTHGQYHRVWDEFIVDTESSIKSVFPHGDQRWIQKLIPERKYFQDVLPGKIVSFKVDCVSGPPDGASIICFHGKPSIPESITETTEVHTSLKRWSIGPSPWVSTYWKTQ